MADMYGQWNHPSSFQTPPIGNNVLRLIAVFIFTYFLQILAGFFYPYNLPELMLRFDGSFHPVQLITHIFSYGPSGPFNAIIHLFFESIILWFVGTELERNWGSHNFLKLFCFGLIGGVLAGAAASYFFRFPMYGFDAGLAAILVAYAMIWPDRQILFFFVIPMKMKWVVVLIFFVLLMNGFPGHFFMQSGGAVAAAFFVYYYAKKGRQASTSSRSPSGGIGVTGRIKEHLRKSRLKKKQEEIQNRIEIKDEVDRLLEKISKEGIGSLTRKEKKFLDRASKEF